MKYVKQLIKGNTQLIRQLAILDLWATLAGIFLLIAFFGYVWQKIIQLKSCHIL